MTGHATISRDQRTLTVRVALAIKKRGGRKLVIAPDGAPWSPSRPRIDSTLVKAVARAHRWKRMLESGKFASVAELAVAEKINESYLCRVLRLTLLAPDIVEAILAGQQPDGLTIAKAMKPFSTEWQEQMGVASNKSWPDTKQTVPLKPSYHRQDTAGSCRQKPSQTKRIWRDGRSRPA